MLPGYAKSVVNADSSRQEGLRDDAEEFMCAASSSSGGRPGHDKLAGSDMELILVKLLEIMNTPRFAISGTSIVILRCGKNCDGAGGLDIANSGTDSGELQRAMPHNKVVRPKHIGLWDNVGELS